MSTSRQQDNPLINFDQIESSFEFGKKYAIPQDLLPNREINPNFVIALFEDGSFANKIRQRIKKRTEKNAKSIGQTLAGKDVGLKHFMRVYTDSNCPCLILDERLLQFITHDQRTPELMFLYKEKEPLPEAGLRKLKNAIDLSKGSNSIKTGINVLIKVDQLNLMTSYSSEQEQIEKRLEDNVDEQPSIHNSAQTKTTQKKRKCCSSNAKSSHATLFSFIPINETREQLNENDYIEFVAPNKFAKCNTVVDLTTEGTTSTSVQTRMAINNLLSEDSEKDVPVNLQWLIKFANLNISDLSGVDTLDLKDKQTLRSGQMALAQLMQPEELAYLKGVKMKTEDILTLRLHQNTAGLIMNAEFISAINKHGKKAYLYALQDFLISFEAANRDEKLIIALYIDYVVFLIEDLKTLSLQTKQPDIYNYVNATILCNSPRAIEKLKNTVNKHIKEIAASKETEQTQNDSSIENTRVMSRKH